MESLQELGFVPGEDGAHQQKADVGFTSQVFFEYAKPLLKKLNEIVLSEVVTQLEKYNGKWHPLGFMIFPLGVNEKLGSLRLHIWPKGARLKIEGGSGIHDHGWCIASYVVAGIYSDERFVIEEVPAYNAKEQLPIDLFRVFRATKTPGLPDALTTDGSIVRAYKVEGVTAKAGNIHTIEPGTFHLPTIGDDQLAATLVLDSPALGVRPRILINRQSIEPIYNARPTVEVKDAIRARNQILNRESRQVRL